MIILVRNNVGLVPQLHVFVPERCVEYILPHAEKYDVAELKGILKDYVKETKSVLGKEVLEHFDEYLPHFKKIIPNDYQRILTAISKYEEQGISHENAELEAFNEMKKG